MTADSNACTSCDSRFTTLNGTRCDLNKDGIFNITDVISYGGFINLTSDVLFGVPIDGTSNWYQLTGNAYVIG